MEEHLAEPLHSRDEVTKHWLLNLAVEFPVGLNRLFPLNTLSLNTKAVPLCTAEDYARSLIALFDSGMVTLSSELPEDDVMSRSGVSRILDRFLALPRDYQRVKYLRPGDRTSLQIDRRPELQVDFRLAEIGGETWEKIAEPDWGRFISVSTICPPYGESGPYQGDLISPDRDLVIAYMGWYPEVNHERIVIETIRWETHVDFEVLYWKRLPFVYHASFHVEATEQRWNYYKAPPWFDDWWTHTLHWHKEPWELPSWPKE